VRPSLERVAGVDGRIELAKSYAEEEDWINALWTLKDANRLEANNATVHELYKAYQADLKEQLAGDDAADDEGTDDERKTRRGGAAAPRRDRLGWGRAGRERPNREASDRDAPTAAAAAEPSEPASPPQ
jgi:hypothetical protein